jgi:molybdopterin synthase sulfur carrier subunit
VADVRIRVRYFASLREQLGSGEEQVVRAGTTPADVWSAVLARTPAVRRTRVRFAVNAEYVDAGHRLADGDELAVFPPVSGG